MRFLLYFAARLKSLAAASAAHLSCPAASAIKKLTPLLCLQTCRSCPAGSAPLPASLDSALELPCWGKLEVAELAGLLAELLGLPAEPLPGPGLPLGVLTCCVSA